MLRRKLKSIWIVALVVAMLSPAAVLADVLSVWLDTSGSMHRRGFEEAKSVLIQMIEAAQPGDVLYIGTFDVSVRLLGRLAVGEDGSPEAKAALISQIRGLEAKGQWTNIDLPVLAGKALLLEERAPGARRLIILSDGLSDPAPGFEQMDLQKIAAIIPQSLGFSLYLISLPEDLEGLFQVPAKEPGVIWAPEAPHIKGIPLQDFTREKIEEAVKVAKEDVPPPASTAPPEPVQETTTHSSPEVSSPPVEQETILVPLPAPTAPAASEQAPPPPLPSTPNPTVEAVVVSASKPFPLPWFLGAALLAVLGAVALFLPRRASGPQHTAFTLEVREGEENIKQFPLTFSEGAKRTIGAKGDMPLMSDPELPAVVCTLHLSKGQLYLTPQDTISVNGQPVTEKILVGVGDRIKVREKVTITINEGGTNQ